MGQRVQQLSQLCKFKNQLQHLPGMKVVRVSVCSSGFEWSSDNSCCKFSGHFDLRGPQKRRTDTCLITLRNTRHIQTLNVCEILISISALLQHSYHNINGRVASGNYELGLQQLVDRRNATDSAEPVSTAETQCQVSQLATCLLVMLQYDRNTTYYWTSRTCTEIFFIKCYFHFRCRSPSLSQLQNPFLYHLRWSNIREKMMM